jgi:stage II sporulation protein AA (anti-sigma F factor antagonist)
MTASYYICRATNPPYPASYLAPTTASTAGETLQVGFAGDLDAGTADQFFLAVLRLLRTARESRLQLDLSGVGFLSAAGVHALVRCQRQAVAMQRRLCVCSPQPIVRRVLQVAGVLELLVSEPASGRKTYRRYGRHGCR